MNSLFLLLIAAVIFDFLNGLMDSSSIVATVISSRALSPKKALTLTAGAHFVSPFLFGVAVATTVGKNLVDPSVITTEVVLFATVAAILWNLITWSFGIPSSSSHALVGGIIGASVISKGFWVIQQAGLIKILLALLISPILGLIVGYLLMTLFLTIFANASPRISHFFRKSQIITSIVLSLSHGTNDAQKTIGIITLGLVTAGYQQTFQVPLWVITLSASAIALGTAFGGWRLIRTLGGRIYKIRPVDAFTSQVASSIVILGAALLGGPVSTTHVVSSSIMGVGAAERISKVHWKVGKEMLIAWGLTIPVSSVLASVLYSLFTQ